MATDAISVLGAGSGMDIKALTTSLVDAERVPRKDAIDKKIPLQMYTHHSCLVSIHSVHF